MLLVCFPSTEQTASRLGRRPSTCLQIEETEVLSTRLAFVTSKEQDLRDSPGQVRPAPVLLQEGEGGGRWRWLLRGPQQ